MMHAYTTQLRRSIREKLENIEDPEYLSTIDAILTWETYPSVQRSATVRRRSFWRRLLGIK